MGFFSLVLTAASFRRPPTLRIPSGSMIGFRVTSGLLLGSGSLFLMQRSSSPKTSCVSLMMRVCASYIWIVSGFKHVFGSLLLQWYLFAMALRLTMALINLCQHENLSKRCEPKECLAEILLVITTSCGLTSWSLSGSTRKKGSFFEVVSLRRCDGPLSHVLSHIFSRGSDLVAWSAGFLSVGTYVQCSGDEDFLIRSTLLELVTAREVQYALHHV